MQSCGGVQTQAPSFSYGVSDHRHCNSVQQADSYGHMARVPARQKGSMVPSGYPWKRSMTAQSSTVVETAAIGLLVTALVADWARVVVEQGMAALQMLSTHHLLVAHMQAVKG